MQQLHSVNCIQTLYNYSFTRTQATASANADEYLNAYAVDDWLTDFYTEHGINQGKVDQGGRDYWTSALANKSKAEVERDILYAAANA
jgi:hypothetical protein